MMAVAADEAGAFDRLVGAYERRVKATVRRFVPNRSSVDDLAQEVFLRLFRARDRYLPTAKFETFLHRVIFNTCVNHTQYMGRRKALSLDAPSSRGDDEPGYTPPDERVGEPVDHVSRSERAVILRRAVDALPDNQRRAIVLSRFEGLSYEQIGDVMGLSNQAVKSLLWRARESLRKQLQPLLGTDDEDT